MEFIGWNEIPKFLEAHEQMILFDADADAVVLENVSIFRSFGPFACVVDLR